jgi:diguanylate cyclase (GGDEF)-like protein/PAS domain S-box-containing protein
MNFAKDAGMSRPEELIGKDDYQMAWANQAELYRSDDRAVIKSGISKLSYVEPITIMNGLEQWVSTSKVPLKNQHNEVIGLLGVYEDITERKRLEKSIHDSESKFRTLFDSSSDAIMLWDTLFFDCNQAALTLFGCKTVAEFCTYHPADLSPLEQPCGTSSLILEQQYIATALKIGSFRFEWTHKKIDTGEIFVAEVLLSALIVNEKPVLQATLRDITERKAIEEKIQQLAFYDPLTGLPNRRKLLDRLQYAIAINRRKNSQFAVFMMDLDKFKVVNDKLGHAAGDELLKQVAVRIIDCLRESDMVARLGGDEFVLILENLKIPDDAETIALKVIADLTRPFQLSENNSVQIGASIGISLYPQHGNTPESLMDHADTALYQAKDNGRGCFAYFLVMG